MDDDDDGDDDTGLEGGGRVGLGGKGIFCDGCCCSSGRIRAVRRSADPKRAAIA